MTTAPAHDTAPPPSRRVFESSTAANEGSFTPGDWVLFVAVAGIWGASFLFIDIGLDALPPGVITLMRVGLGAAALAVVPTPSVRIAPDDRPRLVLLSILWVGIPFTLFPIAEQHINSSVTGLLNGATPIFVALVATLLVRQPPTGALAVGIAVGFVGIVMISAPSLGDGSSQATGVLLVLAATVCYGFATNLAAPLQARYGSLVVMGRMLALGTLWTLPFGLVQLGDAEWELGPVAAVSVLGVVGTGLAFAIMGTLVGRVGPTRASFITYLVPVVSLILGVTLRDDTVAPVAVVGIGFVIGGALIAGRAGRTRAARRRPTATTE